jgi:hypothetical protein
MTQRHSPEKKWNSIFRPVNVIPKWKELLTVDILCFYVFWRRALNMYCVSFLEYSFLDSEKFAVFYPCYS